MTSLVAAIPWLIFIPACFALNMAPGPNNMTAFLNGARMPLGAALLAGLGRAPAFALLILLTAVGLGAALAASATAFWVIKILGAAYLIYIGVKLWRAPPPAVERVGDPPTALAQARQDFLVAIGNPKAIAIFTAFFPQFIDVSRPIEAQVLIMGAAFLALEALAMAFYVLAGLAFGGVLGRSIGFTALNKSVGGFLVFSGVSLAISSRN